MSQQLSPELEKLWNLVKHVEIGMLVTSDEEGLLRSRPMATQKKVFDGEFLFLSSKDSAKIHEIEKHRDVNLAYSEPKSNTYVSISGKAYADNDRVLIKELWNPLYKAWFPKGEEDPDIVVLKVVPDKAEYWDAPASSMVYMIGLAKAVLTGQRFAGEGADHQKVNL